MARLLAGDGFGASRLHVLEALGGPDERVVAGRCDTVAAAEFAALNLVAVEVAGGAEARVLPLAGLPDELLESDGTMTKRAVRAVTLAALAPRRGELLWDIGAGSGSVAVEWMLRHPSLARGRGRGAARPRGDDRAQRARLRGAGPRGGRGTGAGGAGRARRAPRRGLRRRRGERAGGAGGGGGGARPGGRLVANAVTLEGQARLMAAAARLGGELTSIALARAAPLGGMTGWRPALPLMQWAWRK